MTKYRELTQEDKNSFYSFTNNFDCYSDLNFTSLICWSEKVLFSLDSDSLKVIFDDYETGQLVGTCLVKKEADNTINDLLDFSYKKGMILDAIPGVVVDHIREKSLKHNFSISRDHADYLYQPSNQVALSGSKFSWYRRKLSIFTRASADLTTRITHQSEILPNHNLGSLYNHAWKKWTKNINKREVSAIERYLNNILMLDNQSIIEVFIEGELKAFSFVEYVPCKEPTLLIHFFKSDNSYQGLANYLFNQIAQFAHNLDVAYLNFEQDVGEHGLRLFKEKLCPDKMLEKYTYEI